MIKVLIYRVLKLLTRLGVLKNIYEITYKGKIFSLNDLYKQGHWGIRSKLKNKYRDIFLDLLEEAEVKFCKQFYLVVFYNTRHDADNLVGITKVFVDTMKDIYIPDDSKKFYKGLCIFPVTDIPYGTVEFLIVEKNYED